MCLKRNVLTLPLFSTQNTPAMAFRLSLFHTPKPRVFTYRPLYFDPEKEKWEQRRAQLHAQEKIHHSDVEEVFNTQSDISAFDRPGNCEPLFRRDSDFRPGAGIRGSFQRSLIESRRHSVENKYIRIIVLITILMLFLVAVYLSNGLSYLFRSLYTQPLP